MGKEARSGLGLADRLVLLVAWIATCGLVYLLGFYLGKGMQERQLGLEEQVVRLPVTSRPPPEGQRPKSENEFGFYEKLMGEHPPAEARPVAEPPRPVAGSPERTPATPRPSPPASTPAVKPVATGVPSSVQAAAPPKASAAVAAAKVPAPGVVATVAPAPARASGDAAPRPAAEALAPRPVPPAAPPGPPRAAPGPAWTVLANPTQDREEADGLVRQLRGRGYEATLVRVVRDGGTWYRVQVGRFTTAEQASEVMHRLREHEGVTHAFVASE